MFADNMDKRARLYVASLRRTKQHRKGYYYGVVFALDGERIEGHIPATKRSWLTHDARPLPLAQWLLSDGRKFIIVKGSEV